MGAALGGLSTTRPELRGTFGMVSSTHWLASQSAMAMLERGGNAFDAAVAAGFVLQVVEPHMCGLGGEVIMIMFEAEGRRVRVIDGQGPAPSRASIDAVLAMGLDAVPGSGLLGTCVPGAFSAWMRLLDEFGTMRLADVMQIAIEYAELGYPITPRLSARIESLETTFRQHWPESARVYLAGGVPPPGSMLRNPDLASTYRRLVAAGKSARGRSAQIRTAVSAFHEGFVAAEVAKYIGSVAIADHSGHVHPPFLTEQDFNGWRASVEEPVRVAYRGWSVYKAGPPSQGPVLLQQLALLDGFDLQTIGHLSVEWIHTVVECAKLAFADREAWYGDPAFREVPIGELLDPAYNAMRRRLIGERASEGLRPGSPGAQRPMLPRSATEPYAASHHLGGSRRLEGAGHAGDTSHVDVIDRWGNMVAATPSGGWLMSSPLIPGLGLSLGTRAQQCNLLPGHPNSLEGGKRPRTTLSPGIALFEGEPGLAFGSPGGDMQDQWALNLFLNHVDGGLDLQACMDTPTFNSLHFPSSFSPHEAFPMRVQIEDRVDADTISALRDRGHEMQIVPGWSLGHCCAVGRDGRQGLLMAGSNPRFMQGYAVGR